jgi:dienelactone hydrolase
MKLKPAFLLFSLLLSSAPVFAQQAITLTTEDNWKLAANYYPSQNGKAVILLHDIERKKEDFSSFAAKLAESKYGVIALDMRGHGQSTTLGVQKDFKKTGTDNEFNQMVRDVNSAVAFFQTKGVGIEDIYLLGAGLGANVAAKSLIFNQNAAGLILLTPSLKARDVLAMNGLKLYKNPVLVAVSAEDRKAFMEASFIRNAAFLSSGEGKVTFLTAYDKSGAEMLDKYFTYSVLQWLYTPSLPQIKPDAAEGQAEPALDPIATQGVQELPAPSVLQDQNQASVPQQDGAKATAVKVVPSDGITIL